MIFNTSLQQSHERASHKYIKYVHMIRNILYRAVLTLKHLMPASRIAMHMIYLNQFFRMRDVCVCLCLRNILAL